MPMPKARMAPIAESRSRGRAPRVAIRPATTSDPASAPAVGLFAIRSPAAAPVKASSAVPCTANDMPRVTTKGLIRPPVTATRAAASSACWANGWASRNPMFISARSAMPRDHRRCEEPGLAEPRNPS